MLKKILVTVVSLALVLLILFRYTAVPEAFPEQSASAQMLEHGPFAVTLEELRAVDELRTVPDSYVEGQTMPRAIDYRIWYPESDAALQGQSPMPLVMYSHGMMGNYDEGVHYAELFASHGYVFVAPNFPLTNMSNGEEADSTDVVNQPGDISYLIDLVLARNTDPNDPLFGRINTDQIVAMGLSLGGMTTHMLGYDPVRLDKRIAAAIAIAAPSEMFSAKYFGSRSMPYLAIASPGDSFISYTANAVPVLSKIKQSALVTIDGGSHTGYAYQSRWLRWIDNPDSIGCSMVKKNLDATIDQGDTLYDLLGSVEDGFIVKTDIQVCEAELDTAMNPIRQNELTLLAAWSFLQCQYAEDAQRYCDFLSNKLPEENANVTYRSSVGQSSIGESSAG